MTVDYITHQGCQALRRLTCDALSKVLNKPMKSAGLQIRGRLEILPEGCCALCPMPSHAAAPRMDAEAPWPPVQAVLGRQMCLFVPVEVATLGLCWEHSHIWPL